MNIVEYDIKHQLESEFDIPFTVQKTLEGGEPCYSITPTNPGKELFTLKVCFKNKIRLSVEFIPQVYSANFIRALGEQPEASRKTFLAYYNLLRQRGAKCSIYVNRVVLDIEDCNQWPTTWNSFEARITKMPVTLDSPLDYEKAACEWGSIVMGMILSLTTIVPLDDDNNEAQLKIDVAGKAEGRAHRSESNRYERNPHNRKICLAIYGYSCKVCGFNFSEQYGEIGENYIHVHHITPVSQLGDDYIINPATDLIPVCPNCHAMLHRKDPPYLPCDLEEIVNTRKKVSCAVVGYK